MHEGNLREGKAYPPTQTTLSPTSHVPTGTPAVSQAQRVSGEIVPVPPLDVLEHEWRNLEQRAGMSFFLSWGWIGSWLRLIAGSQDTWLFRVVDGSETIGLAVLCRETIRRGRGMIRSRQLQLNERARGRLDMIIEKNGLLAAPGRLGDCWRALDEALQSFIPGWDELAVRSLGPEQQEEAGRALRGFRLELDRAVPTWVTLLRPEYEGEDHLLQAFRKKQRQQIRQGLRAFRDIGPLTLECSNGPKQALGFFDEMGALHTGRWERVGGRGSFANSQWVAFHRDVIAHGSSRGEALLFRAKAGAETMGIVYGHLFDDWFLAHQTGFRHYESSALRSGYVCHFLAMQWLASRGVRGYDFLPDKESSYKRFLSEPSELYQTSRFQRRRLRFGLERLLVGVHARLRRTTSGEASVTPDSDPT